MAERFALKIIDPKCSWLLLVQRLLFGAPPQLVPNPLSFVLCMGSGRCASKLLPIVLKEETSKMGFSHKGTQPTEKEMDQQ